MTPDEFNQIISRQELESAIRGTSPPCYLFFRRIIERQLERLRSILGDAFDVHYAVKANPNPAILRMLQSLGTGADVASEGELLAALGAAFEPRRIEFSGPGKTQRELERALELGIGCVNVESLAEIELLIEIAKKVGKRARIGLRINPVVEATAGLRMAGATQFGLGQAELETALACVQEAGDAAELRGLHVHVGSQILDAESVLAVFQSALDLAVRVRDHTGAPPSKLNFGGGWGVTYFEGQTTLDLETIGTGFANLMRRPEYASAVQGTSLIVEPGRFLVAESGLYVAQILYVKESGGERFAVVDGGMHHNYLLAGGMGQVIRRNFFLSILPQEGQREACASFRLNIAGSLCTPQDLLARQVQCDHQVCSGDYIVFFNSGAYGLTASPTNFLGHPPPAERLIP